jgi:hypothetical protein
MGRDGHRSWPRLQLENGMSVGSMQVDSKRTADRLAELDVVRDDEQAALKGLERDRVSGSIVEIYCA